MNEYGELQFDNTVWRISNLQPHVAIRLKQLFPRIPKYQSSLFSLGDTLDNAADLLWFTQRYPLKISAQDLRRLRRANQMLIRERAEREAIRLPSYKPTQRQGLKPGERLRHYQQVAVDTGEKVKRFILIDDVGLGKTYEGLGMSLIKNILPIIYVMEPALQEQWADKAEQFVNLKVHKVKGNKPYSLPPADIYLFKYTQLSPWVDVISSNHFKSIIYDEIQNLRRGTESQRGAAAEIINQTMDYVIGMTATLIYNYGIEAFNIVNLVRPGILGSEAEFKREYCTDTGPNSKGIVANPEALGNYLLDQGVFLRRTKADVGQQCHQLRPHIEWIEPDLSQVANIEKLAEQLAIKTLQSTSFFERGNAARDFDLRMRLATGIAKARGVAAYVRMFVETGTPILLYGWHREVYRIWANELSDLNPVFYTGSETPTQKEAAKQKFISGESNLMIMSLRSGVGVDGLQFRCSTVIFGEEDFSPKILTQNVGRLDRDGQEEEVFVFHTLTRYGSDPDMLALLGVKDAQAHGIQDPGRSIVEQQIDHDRIKNLARKYLADRHIQLPAATSPDVDLEAMKSLI